MGLTQAVRQLIPPSLKNALRQRTLSHRLARMLGPHLPEAVCVDVGASFYPHVKWLTFLSAPRTHWLAVEPNRDNLKYLDQWAWPCKVSACSTGLSREGGPQTLYITNVDTGSSLLPPDIPASMKHRITRLDYFFPVTPRQIETITLEAAMAGLSRTAPVFVKLDTQGTELSILQGAQALFDVHRIVGVEMESTLLAEPIMKGSGKFWEACQYMELQGFELLHVKPIQAPKAGRSKPQLNTYLNECDAVFALRRDIAASLPVESRIGLLAFYLTNMLCEEALSILEADDGVRNHLQSQGCPVDALRSLLLTAIR